MESFGAILKKAREEKSLDFETIARDTTITQEYLDALEREESNVFPGEPYMVGFLKIYADYLEVDTNHIMALYKAKKIQESPPPLALTARERPKFLIPLIITLVAAIFITVMVFLGIYVKDRILKGR